MSGLLQLIARERGRMNRQEAKLADYITADPRRAVHMGISDLAEASGTSTATVSRFCRSFHLNGYQDFKLKLAADLSRPAEARTYQDIRAGNPLPQVVEAIRTNHLRSIEDTTRLNDYDKLKQAVDALYAAKHIDIYGAATSGIVAEDLSQKLNRIGKRALHQSDSHMQVTSAAHLQPGDVAFAISYSGETPETLEALQCAKEQGAVGITLTKFGPSRLAALGDIRLFTSSLEAGMRRGDMASRIAQLHVIDILFTSLVSEHFDEFVPRLESAFHMVQKYKKDRGRD